jgi:hypothetical protein
MFDDPIVEEVRKVRNDHAKKFNYDLAAIAADLRAQQAASQHVVVTFKPRKAQPVTLQKKPAPVIADNSGKYKS